MVAIVAFLMAPGTNTPGSSSPSSGDVPGQYCQKKLDLSPTSGEISRTDQRRNTWQTLQSS